MADAVVVDPAILSNIQFYNKSEQQPDASVIKEDKVKISKTWKPERTISAVWSGGNFEFSADGEIAYSLHDGKVFACKTENMNVEKTVEFENEYIMTFTVYKKLMVTTGKNGGLRLWNLDTSTWIKYIGTGSSVILDMKFDPSGRYLACGTADRKVKVFDILKDKLTHDFIGHKLSVSLVRWLPCKSQSKNKFIVYSASEEGVIKVWDLVLNSWLGTLQYHHSQIPWITFTNDLKTLIVSSRDQKLSFWSLKDNTFTKIGALQLNEDVEGMQYVNLQISKTKTAPYLITGGTDGKLKILDINNQKYIYEEEDPLKQEIEKVFYLQKESQILALTNDQVLTYYSLLINESTECPQLKRLYSLCLYNDEIIDLKFLKWLDDHIVMWSNSELAKVVDLKTQK